MSSIELIGTNILKHLKSLNRPVLGLIQNGLSKEEIDHHESFFPFEFPKQVKELYSWRNGTLVHSGDVLDDLHFFPGFYFLSIKDSLSYYKNFISDSRWNANWLPLFANGGGDFYCAICNQDDPAKSPILGFMLDCCEPEVEYESIHSMLKTVIDAYEASAYYVDESGYLEVDSDKETVIARNNNPSLSYWL